MGIKKAIMRAAGKAGDAVAKVSGLSPDQLRQVDEMRAEYLSLAPNPDDPSAKEATHRMLAACGVEIFNAYLPQISQLYAPVEPGFEYCLYGEGQRAFDASHNIRYVNITKWITDPREDSLEKLVSVYDVLANEDCNIALIFNRTKQTTNVYLAVVDTRNNDNNINVDSYAQRLIEAMQGNFPGSEMSDTQQGTVPCLHKVDGLSLAAVSNIPTEKSEKFISQTIEKLIDGIVPTCAREEYTLILLATPVHDIEERKLRLAELYTALAPYAGWQTNFTFTESDSTMAMATVGVNAGVSAGTQQGTNSSLAGSESTADSSSSTNTDTTSEGATNTEGSFKSTTGGVSVTEGASFTAAAKLFGIGPEATGSVSASEKY